MSKKYNNATNIIVAILSILLVVAIVGFVFKFTNGLNEDLKTFYIEHNGKQIVATDSKMTFDTESEHRFDCKYISNPDDNTFNLKVVPNVTEETDFSYTVDGESHKWSEVEDLTSCFNLDKQANYFIVSFPADFSMQGVLNSLYPESQVVISDTLSLYQYYYTLHVSNYNEKINYYIDFNVCDFENYIETINSQLDTISTLQIEIDDLENQRLNLQSSLNDRNLQITELQAQITVLENEKKNLVSTNNANLEEINSLNSEIMDLKNQITELQTNIQTNNTEILNLQRQISTLTDEKTALQQSVAYYENYISSFEDSETAIITLEVDGSVYALFAMAKGSTLFDINIRETDFKFNGWTLNGESVDLSLFVVNENVTFVADIERNYEITFVVDNEVIKTEVALKGTVLSLPEIPYKVGYNAIGWFNSNNEFVNTTEYVVENSETLTAKYQLIEITIELASATSDGVFGTGAGGKVTYSPSSVVLSVAEPVVSINYFINSGYEYVFWELNEGTLNNSGNVVTPYSTDTEDFIYVVIDSSSITFSLNMDYSGSFSYTYHFIMTVKTISDSGSTDF